MCHAYIDYWVSDGRILEKHFCMCISFSEMAKVGYNGISV